MRRIGTPKRAVATLGLAMVLVIGAMAIPAHAVHWTLGYAFGNTDVLCYGCPKSNSNAAGFWEQALVSHWGLPGTGVDGVFDGGTTVLTQGWQTDHGLTADGVVGSNTWNAARFWHVGQYPKWDDGTWQYWPYNDGGRGPALFVWKPWTTWYTTPLLCPSLGYAQMITGEANTVSWQTNCY